MNYINFCLICFQIWCIYKYIKKLRDTDERFKQNEIDYFEVKAQIKKFECYLKNLDEEIEDLKKNQRLHNKNE